ncbi:TPR domain-containing protein [Apiospora kogelbergensis]|uniref:TPR domain-containing protein n=1 Tax=Apiospora kogelbergensis TaxID=1337665 RepID=A0AAW0Q8M4_9PEZI
MLPSGVPLRPSDLAQPINYNVHIRSCALPERGLGVFATHRISKGLKILSESPILLDETREGLIDTIDQDFASLPPASQSLFTRFHAGRFDMVPLMINDRVRNQESVTTARLRLIAQLNSLEGAGVGCALSPTIAAINHDCIPNAFVYFNYETHLITLHALRDIAPNEEVTISYHQENVYLNAGERGQRLAN